MLFIGYNLVGALFPADMGRGNRPCKGDGARKDEAVKAA
jgi:hypothetical protein